MSCSSGTGQGGGNSGGGGGKSASEKLGKLSGKRDRKLGKGTTAGGYEKWYHPDGSRVQIGPDGEVDRTPPSSFGKGWRVTPDGNLARPHTGSHRRK